MHISATHTLPHAPACRPSRRAAVVVEFALVLPFITTLVLGMVEIGHGMMVKETLSDAAQKACRTAAQTGKTTAQAQTDVDNIMEDNNITGYTTVILLNNSPTDIKNAKHNDQVSVSVSVPVANVFWTTSFFLPVQNVESEVVVMLRQG
jgi:Flp pilus assembly protein TadG